jgi:hypothetical protein
MRVDTIDVPWKSASAGKAFASIGSVLWANFILGLLNAIPCAFVRSAAADPRSEFHWVKGSRALLFSKRFCRNGYDHRFISFSVPMG